jgi:tetratricopeptide (TPR) repeat protein
VYDSAELHFRATLELFRQLHGERHPRAIQSLYNLGYIVGHKGDLATATTMMRQSVEMMRRSEPQNGELPRMLLDLGERLSWAERYSEAEALILEAREAFRKLRGTEDHYEVAYTFCRLGNLYRDKGELERAQAAYQEFLERLRRFPVKHEAGEALFNLGVIDYTRGNYQEAEKRLSEADKLFSQYLGESFTQIAEFLYYLASIHCLQKDYARAEAEARRALEIRRQKQGPDHPWTIVSLGLLSKVLISAGRPANAAPYLREAMEKFRAAPDRNKWHQVAGILGECLMLLKRYEEAERLLIESCTIHQCDCGGKSRGTFLIEMCQRLVKLYEAWGKKEQAARFRTE